MTEFLNDNVKGQVREALAQMQHPVQVLFFGSKENCDYCNDTRQLVEEVCALSDKLSLSIYDTLSDAAVATQHHVDKTPGLVIHKRRRCDHRFWYPPGRDPRRARVHIAHPGYPAGLEQKLRPERADA